MLGLALLVNVRPLSGQHVRIGVDAIGLTYSEIREGREAVGQGGGGRLELRAGRWRLDVRAHRATLESVDSTVASFDLAQVDVRAAFQIADPIALEVGGGRRFISPDFAAQEVGVIRLGVASETRLARIASIWVRGAYLVDPRFTGGGTADLAFEFGLGVGVGTANGRFRVHADYEFQRIDREVGGSSSGGGALSVPLQLSLARAGLALGF